MKKLILLLCLCGIMSCDKLANDNVTAETLPGKWAFSYRTTEPLGMEFSYDYIVFRNDATCDIHYDGGALEGTYRASDALIRIDSKDDQQTQMWKVISISPHKIVAEYDYELQGGQHVTVTVTLERL